MFYCKMCSTEVGYGQCLPIHTFYYNAAHMSICGLKNHGKPCRITGVGITGWKIADKTTPHCRRRNSGRRAAAGRLLCE